MRRDRLVRRGALQQLVAVGLQVTAGHTNLRTIQFLGQSVVPTVAKSGTAALERPLQRKETAWCGHPRGVLAVTRFHRVVVSDLMVEAAFAQ